MSIRWPRCGWSPFVRLEKKKSEMFRYAHPSQPAGLVRSEAIRKRDGWGWGGEYKRSREIMMMMRWASQRAWLSLYALVRPRWTHTHLIANVLQLDAHIQVGREIEKNKARPSCAAAAVHTHITVSMNDRVSSQVQRRCNMQRQFRRTAVYAVYRDYRMRFSFHSDHHFLISVFLLFFLSFTLVGVGIVCRARNIRNSKKQEGFLGCLNGPEKKIGFGKVQQ